MSIEFPPIFDGGPIWDPNLSTSKNRRRFRQYHKLFELSLKRQIRCPGEQPSEISMEDLNYDLHPEGTTLSERNAAERVVSLFTSEATPPSDRHRIRKSGAELIKQVEKDLRQMQIEGGIDE